MNDQQRAAMQMALNKKVHEALSQPQEALQDIVTYGQHISIGGERIDPSDFYLKPEQPQVSLLDSDGENKAVRCFLMLYGSKGLTVGKMRQHMTRCGYPLWPDVVADTHEDAHLTKAEAQTWIRHLLALAQPQGSWVDLTDDELLDELVALDANTKRLPIGFRLFAKAIIAKFKAKNTPPVVPQEPVAKVDSNDEGIWADILPDRDVKVGQFLYATPPTVEAVAGSDDDTDKAAELGWHLQAQINAAIETTKEKAAKVCEELDLISLQSEEPWIVSAERCAAAIRSMK